MVSEPAATLLAAVIAAVASVVAALLAMWVAQRTYRNQESLARLTAQLEERKSVEQARQDYRYDALKRLYAECGPLLFEIADSAEDARRRVLGLARTGREGHLGAGRSSWMADEGYYFESTAYRLFAPLAAFRILQRRLTAVDLTVEPRLEMQYALLRLLYRSFTDDHDLADMAPAKPYKPDDEAPGSMARRRAVPEVYVRQGLYRGTLDRLVDSMIVVDGGLERTTTFGEFVEARETPDTRTKLQRKALRALLLDFHPATRPVLWRVLVSQVLLYEALRTSATVELEELTVTDLLPERLVAQLHELEWDSPNGPPGTSSTVRAAWTHLTAELGSRGVARSGSPETAPRTVAAKPVDRQSDVMP